MAELGIAASVIAVVDLSSKVASLCFQYSKEVLSAKKDIGRLRGEVFRLKDVSLKAKRLLESPHAAKLEASQELLVAAQDSLSELQQLERKLHPAIRRVGLHALKWPLQSKDIDKMVQSLGRCVQALSLGLQVDEVTILLEADQNILRIYEKTFDFDRKALLDMLPTSTGASFDSYAEEYNPICLKNTRVAILQAISTWADEPCSKAIFWVNGKAGTGKSTISRTVAQTFARSGKLGASFFFKRGEADRSDLSKFFTTIAGQLVVRQPAVAMHVKNALDADPYISDKAAREQFDKLILEPLSKVPRSDREAAPIVVIDALDECEMDKDVGLLLELISSIATLPVPGLRLFFTSRPELPIRQAFSIIQAVCQDVVLHSVPDDVVELDLFTYIDHELANIKKRYNESVPHDRQLSPTWPGYARIHLLIKMAAPLFIFAATACRFVADRKCGNPDRQLTEFLEYQATSQESHLDATYLPILNQQLSGLPPKRRDQVLQQFKSIVGSIVILASPLSAGALSRLLNVCKSDVDDRLDFLHSVLSVPPSVSEPIRLFHISFRDFLVDPSKAEKSPFWVDQRHAHGTIARNCLRIMNEQLRTNICSVRTPGTRRSTIDGGEIDDCLPPELQYACRFWLYHLQQSASPVCDGDPHDKFLKLHLLHWVEALSLIGRAADSLYGIKTLTSILKPGASSNLFKFLADATRLLRSNIAIRPAYIDIHRNSGRYIDIQIGGENYLDIDISR